MFVRDATCQIHCTLHIMADARVALASAKHQVRPNLAAVFPPVSSVNHACAGQPPEDASC